MNKFVGAWLHWITWHSNAQESEDGCRGITDIEHKPIQFGLQRQVLKWSQQVHV